MGSCRAWSVYLTTLSLGRLSPLRAANPGGQNSVTEGLLLWSYIVSFSHWSFNTFWEKDFSILYPYKCRRMQICAAKKVKCQPRIIIGTRKGFFRKTKQNKTKKKTKKQQMSPSHPSILSVILVRNISSRPVLHLYQVSSKYSKGYLCYRAETSN